MDAGRNDTGIGVTRRIALVLLIAGILTIALSCVASSQGNAVGPIPRISIGVGKAQSPQDVSTTLQILFLLTILTLAPAILVMTTAFTRVVIVLSFLRTALGAQGIPLPDILHHGPGSQ